MDPHLAARLCDVSPDLLGAVDARGLLFESNAAWRDRLGWPREALAQVRWSDLFHPDDRERAARALEEAGPEGVSLAGRLRTARGGTRSVEWTLRRDPEREPVYVVGRLATPEAELAERCLTAFQDAPIGMVIVDRSGAIVAANAALADLLGRAEEGLEGRRVDEIVDPDALDPEGSRRRVLRGELASFRRTAPLATPEGVRWCDLTVTGLRHPDGAVREVLATVTDITERRRAEEATRRAEAWLRTVFEMAPSGIVLTQLDGRFVLANRAFEAMVGYGEGELVGRMVAEVTHPDEREATARFMREVAEGRPPSYRFEKRYLHKDGSALWGLVRVTTVPGEEGEQFIAMVEDITERKLSEEALRTSEERLRTIFELAPVGIGLTDEAGRFVATNRALQTMLGYAKEELEELAVRDVTHPDDRPSTLGLLGELLRGERGGYDVEKRLLRKDGAPAWARVRAAALPHVDGERRFVGIIEDVTERHAAEEALRSSEARFRSVFELAPIGMVLTTRDGEAIETNRALQNMFGYDRDELARLGMSGVSHPEDVEVSRRFLAELAAGARDGYEVEKRYIRKDGSTVWARVKAGYVSRARGARELIAMVEDVTERRATEAALLAKEHELRQAQKMEAVGQLAGGVAHDFNNLLTVIAGHSRLARVDVGDEHPAAADLTEIDRAAERAAALTRQLLAFSRKQVLQPEVVDVDEVISGIEPMLRRLLPEVIALEHVRTAGRATVEVDRGQLEQVVLNLALNARDAMPQGGRVTIRARHEEVREAEGARSPEPGRWVRLDVEDTGCGMDAITQARALEPFFTTKPPGKGTGLGLSTAYGIVTQSGGHLVLRSRLGAGTTASVFLPVAASQPMPGGGTRATTVRGGHETILLVEDDEAVRALTRRALAEQGYRVLAASDPQHALELLRAGLEPIDLLLTDLVMPGGNGRELAAEVLRLQPRARLLYTTGYADAVADEALRPLLLKPYTPEGLARQVREVLDAAAE